MTRAVVEGAAVYIEDAYWQQYIQNGTRPSQDVAASYQQATGRQRYVLSAHHFGYRYVNATVESPKAVPTVYEQPPQTTEELIHQSPPGSEPPVPLSVVHAPRSDKQRWEPAD